jgi:uncharacterized membrane protein
MRAPPRRRNSARSILLAISIGVNLFLIGWEVTQHLAAPTYAKPDPAPETVAEAIAGALPPADGELLRQAFSEKRQTLSEARRRYLLAVDHVRQVISAEPLDRPAFQEAIVELRASRQAERQIFGDTMQDVIPRLSPQGRRAFVATHMGGRS